MREGTNKKLIKLFLFTFICMFLFFGFCKLDTKALETDEEIYHIITTVTEAPSNSMMVNYHCKSRGSYVLYTTMDDTEFENAKKVMPTEEEWSTEGLKNASSKSGFYTKRIVCNAKLENLEARTSYIYKIVSGEIESKVNSFTTAGLTNTWNFSTFVDFQYRLNTVTHKLIKNMKEISNPALMICTGDLVDVADNEHEWTHIFDNEEFSNYVFASSPGDHEYWGDEEAGHPQWDFPYTFVKMMHFPTNGCSSSAGTNYYFIYNNVLFISLDMNNSDVSRHTRITEQATWFKNTVKSLEGHYQYSVVFMHKSIFGSEIEDSSVAKNLRPVWADVFKECNVDLVLSGHDHMYSRTYRLNGTKKSSSSGVGTYYLDMGSSGDKRRASDSSTVSGDAYHEVALNLNTLGYSCATDISVSAEEMVVTVYNQYKKAIDTFTIKAKRSAKAIEIEDFDKFNFAKAIELKALNLDAKIAQLNIGYSKSGKYVSNVRVLDGDTEILNKAYGNNGNYECLIRDFKNTTLKFELTLTDGSKQEITKAINICNNDDIKLEYLPYEISFKKDTVKEYLISNNYKYDLIVDGNKIKDKQTFDTKIEFTNDYYNNNHTIEIQTYDKDNNLVGSYSVEAERLPDIVLPEESIEMDIKYVMLFSIRHRCKDLIECESDLIEYDKENASISALKTGEGTARFRISGTDIYTDIPVKITGEEPVAQKSGCNSKEAFYQVFSYLLILAYVLYRRKKYF